MLSKLIILVVWIFSIVVIGGNPGDPYGMIDPVKTECEFQALTQGSRLSDAFNSYDESVSFYRRFNHEYLQRSQSFHRIIMFELERRHLLFFLQENNIKLANEERIHKYHHHQHHHHHNADHSHPFHGLSNKHVHFIGDSTLFPVFSSLLLPLHAHSQNDMLERMLMDMCMDSSQTITQLPIADLSTTDRYSLNCVGYGGEGRLNYHQSLFLLEQNAFETIKALFPPVEQPAAASDPVPPGGRPRAPDVLVIQGGYYTCLLPYNKTAGLNYDNYVKVSEDNAGKLFQSLRDFLTGNYPNTTVIISLPSRSFLNTAIQWEADHCLWRLNRIIAYQAHKFGFPVLEREEIEYRLLSKHERSPEPLKPPKALVAFPGVQIVASSLVTLLSCMDQRMEFSL